MDRGAPEADCADDHNFGIDQPKDKSDPNQRKSESGHLQGRDFPGEGEIKDYLGDKVTKSPHRYWNVSEV